MLRVVNRGVVLFIMSIICFGVYAQTDPPVKVVVIPLFVGDEAATDKVIFITKDTFTGNLGGLGGADEKCQADADAPDSKVKGKIFKAWLGPPTNPLAGGRQFIVYDLPYLTTNGALYAGSYSSLIALSPWPYLFTDAAGADVSDVSFYDDVWTGLLFSGTVVDDRHCTRWFTDSPSFTGVSFGETSRSSRRYTRVFVACSSDPDERVRLICMEQ